jgi:hypothetical protein
MSMNQRTQKNQQTEKNERTKRPKSQPAQQNALEQLRSNPETVSGQDVLAAQQRVGNQTVQRALNRVSDEEITDEQGNLTDDLSRQIQARRGQGDSLPVSLQQEAKDKLGHDFNDVRIHTDETADQLSQQINAQAFTIGKDVFFKRGAYTPGGAKGRQTLLHELTHVVQQSGSEPSGQLKLGAPDTAHEKEAERISQDAGAQVSPVGGEVQRETKDEDDDVKIGLAKFLGMDESKALGTRGQSQDSDSGTGEAKDDDNTGGAISDDERSQLMGTLGEVGMGGDEKDDDTDDLTATGSAKVGGGPSADSALGGANATTQAGTGLASANGGQPSILGGASAVLGSIGAATSLNPNIPKAPPLPASSGSAQTSDSEPVQGPANSFENQIASQRKSMGIGSEENVGVLNSIDASRQDQFDKRIDTQYKRSGSGKGIRKGVLLDTIRDPNKSDEEIAKAKQELEDMHGSKMNSFKKIFGKDQASKAAKQREESMKGAAERGEAGAYDKYKSYKDSNPSTGKKLGGFLKSGLSKGFGMLKGQLGIGGEEKKEAAPAAAAGGGGGGIAAMMDEYAKVKNENAKLKEENEKLKAGA